MMYISQITMLTPWIYAMVCVNYVSIKFGGGEYLEQGDKEHITFKDL